MKPSNTALAVLKATARRDDRLVRRRLGAPPVVDFNVCRALVKQRLLEVVRAPADAAGLVSVREANKLIAFVIADAGFRAINMEPLRSVPGVLGSQRVSTTLHDAATAVVQAWGNIKDRRGGVATALALSITALSTVLTSRQKRKPRAPSKPREGTKQLTCADV